MIHCNDCESDCCKYIAIEIDEPETKEDFDELRWFLAHENVRVYKDNDEDWLVEFRTPCKFLDKETNMCQIYDKRPKTCAEHGMDECVRNGEGDVELIAFNTIEEVEEYMKNKFPDLKLPLHNK